MPCFTARFLCFLGVSFWSAALIHAQNRLISGPLDLGFVLHASKNFNSSDWGKVQEFTRAIVDRFEVSESSVHLGIVKYGDTASTGLKFNEYSGDDVNNANVRNSIDALSTEGTRNMVNSGLQVAEWELFKAENGMRTNSIKVALVFTSGAQTRKEDLPSNMQSGYETPKAVADRLRSKGVRVIAVGCCNADAAELREIAAGDEYTVMAGSVGQLKGKVSQIVGMASSAGGGVQSGGAMDFGFVLDSSSANSRDWSSVQQFARKIVDQLNPKSGGNNVGVVNFGETAERPLSFKTLSGGEISASNVNNAIDGIRTEGRYRMINRGLASAEQLFTTGEGMRAGVAKVALVFTSGAQTRKGGLPASMQSGYETPKEVADRLRSKGVRVIAVGCCNADASELREIAGGYQFTVMAGSVGELEGKVSEIVSMARSAGGGVQSGGAMDFGFVLDSSSANSRDWSSVQQFARKIVDQLNPKSGGNNVGVVNFGETAERPLSFKTLSGGEISASNVNNAIDGIRTEGRYRMINRGLASAEQLFTTGEGMRAGVAKVALVFTSGAQTRKGGLPASMQSGYETPKEVADRLRRKGVRVIAVGCCNADASELREIAGGDQFTVMAGSVGELEGKVSEIVSMARSAGGGVQSGGAMDFGFVLDSSSANSRDWSSVQQFARKIVDQLNPKSGGNNVGVVNFGETAERPLSFKTLSGGEISASNVNNAIDGIRTEGRYRMINRGLASAEQLFTTGEGMRAGVAKVALVFTSGAQTRKGGLPASMQSGYETPKEVADRLRSKGVRVIAVGCCNADASELREIAGGYQFTVMAGSVGELEGKVSEIVSMARSAGGGVQSGGAMDFGFVLDSSSANSRDWSSVQQFARKIVDQLNPKSGGNNVGVVNFGETAERPLSFKTLSGGEISASNVNNAIDGIRTEGRYRMINRGLASAEQLFTTGEGMRAGVAKVALVFTSGAQTRKRDLPAGMQSGYETPKEVADRLRSKGVRVIAVGCCNADASELREIAGGDQFTVMAGSVGELEGKVSEIVSMARSAGGGVQSGGAMDFGFVLDSSSANSRDWSSVQQFARKIVDQLNPKSGGNNVGVVNFGETAERPLSFKTLSGGEISASNVNNAIDGIRTEGRYRMINRGLASAEQLFTTGEGMRAGVAKVALVFTSGAQTRKRDLPAGMQSGYETPKEVADRLRSKGVRVIAVGCCNADASELREIAGGDQFTVMAGSVGELEGKVSEIVSMARSAGGGVQSGGAMDFGFVLDSSSANSRDWSSVQQFARKIVDQLNPKSGGNNVGVVNFGETAERPLSFKTLSGGEISASNVNNAIDGIRTEGRYRMINRGLASAEQLFTTGEGMRAGVAKVALVFTSGAQTRKRDLPAGMQSGYETPKEVADRLRSKGVRVIAVGCCNADASELREIAGGDQFTVMAGSVGELEGKVSEIVSMARSAGGGVQSGGAMDFGFVLDSSSANSRDWSSVQQFARKIVDQLNPKSGGNNVGVVNFGETAERPLSFKTLSGGEISASNVNNAIDGIRTEGRYRMINRGLASAEQLFTTGEGMRAGVAKVALVFTSGAQTRKRDLPAGMQSGYETPKEVADRLRSKGVRVIAVGCCNADASELREIAGGDQFTVMAGSVGELEGKVSEIVSMARSAGGGVQSGGAMDFGFVLDSSSANSRDWSSVQQFARKIVDQLNPKSGGNNVGVVNFGETAERPLSFKTLSGGEISASNVNNAIDGIRTEGRYRMINRGLASAEQLFTTGEGMRAGVAKVALVFTSGAQTRKRDLPAGMQSGYETPKEVADRLRSKGVRVIAVGCCNADASELREIAGGDQFTVMTGSVGELEGKVSEIVSMARSAGGGVQSGGAMDFGFVLDSSSANSRDWSSVQQFARKIVDQLNPKSGGNNVGVVNFGETAERPLSFKTLSGGEISASNVNNAIDGIRTEGRYRMINRGLASAEQLFTTGEGMRAGVAKVALVFTSGAQTRKRDLPAGMQSGYETPKEVADRLRSKGVRVIAVGCCNADASELREIAGGDQFTVMAGSVGELEGKVSEIVSIVSSDIPPIVPPAKPDPNAVDVSFVLQSSDTVPGGWRDVQQFAKRLTDRLNPSARGNHVSIVNFADSASTPLKFDTLPESDINARNVKTRIDGIRSGGQLNLISRGLKAADQQIFTTGAGMRQAVRKVALVFTSGVQTRKGDLPFSMQSGYETPKAVADRLRRKGVQVIAVGCCNADTAELREIAGGDEFTVMGGSVRDLENKVNRIINIVEGNIPPIVPPAKPDPNAVDVSFVLQSSDTVPGGWSNVQQFAKRLTDRLNPSARGNHVSIVNFADSASTPLKFDTFPESDINARNVKTRIDGIRSGGQRNLISRGLGAADQQIFTTAAGMRQGVRKVAIVFTSGAQTRREDLPSDMQSGYETPKAVADRLRRKGVRVIAVGCCNADAAELREIAGGDEFTVMGRSVRDLEGKVRRIVDMAEGRRVEPEKPDPYARDIGFILSSSGSISGRWSRVQQLLQRAVDRLKPSALGNHVGVVNFADTASVPLAFNTLSGGDITSANVKNKISGISTGGRYRLIYRGLSKADQSLFRESVGMRASVPKVAVLFTDGSQTAASSLPSNLRRNYESPELMAKRLRSRGISVVAVGCCDADQAELDKITGNRRLTIMAGNLQDLDGVVDQLVNRATTASTRQTTIRVYGTQGSDGPQGNKGYRGTRGDFGLRGPQGDRGPQGRPGRRGDRGAVGRRGQPGTHGLLPQATLPGDKGPLIPVQVVSAAAGFIQQDIQGDPGRPGPPGQDGIPGKAGDQGPVGDPGPAGIVGSAGLAGPIGVEGEAGEIGPAGKIGPAGVSGLKGPFGDTGVRGRAGSAGNLGDMGIPGDKGLPGEEGEMGLTGAKGPAGRNGRLGEIGETGLHGPPGPRGQVGIRGKQGLEGNVGPQGPSGIFGGPGLPGEEGPKGRPGQPGLSGKTGYPGDPGDPGLHGKKGSDGSDGLRGPKGRRGAKGSLGDTGGAGPTGDTGPEGIKGEPGEDGYEGARGVQGDRGSPGTNGLAGDKGSPGAQGSKGSRGTPGPAGPEGDQGSPGVEGSSGDTGARGVPGLDGFSGRNGLGGSKGSTGRRGRKGGSGKKGASGVLGQVGPPGRAGEQGSVGRTGLPGLRGKTGPIGENGDDGSPGQDGSPGLQGPKGALGIRGTMGDKGSRGRGGPPGDRGEPGIEGERGPEGSRGRRGDPGGQGIKGRQGEPGLTGEPGDTGADGSNGIIGRPGRPGSRGSKGTRGTGGISGKKGAAGLPGPSGSPGADGPNGVIGAIGDSGRDGTKGSTGRIGVRGPDGFQGSVGLRGLSGDPGSPGAKGEMGVKGRQGGMGVPGVAGIGGADGTPGMQGSPGIKGLKGLVGDPGVAGNQGASGNTGPQGDTGAKGGNGFGGLRGAPGRVGAQGTPGKTGQRGPAGDVGARGRPGGNGQQGSRGVMGSKGPEGDRGDPGSGGPLGPSGSPGPDGPAGESGDKGVPGRPGRSARKGSQGEPGTPGNMGNPGSSGLKGFAGTPGVTGDRGRLGRQGPKGAVGFSGLPGRRGVVGVTGSPGKTGEPGIKGEEGDRGHDGKHGVPGKAGQNGAPGEKGREGEGGMPGDVGSVGSSGRSGDKGVKGQLGDNGAPGIMGAQGAPGADGIAGDVGTSGNQGEPGVAGNPGAPGTRGQAGDRGSMGGAGEPGFSGQDGIKGDRGDIGPRGPSGSPGPKGNTGEKGQTGQTGSVGDRGVDGELGPRGSRGIEGPEGEPGYRGKLGQKGSAGREGFEGPQGFPGSPGPAGLSGSTLLQGMLEESRERAHNGGRSRREVEQSLIDPRSTVIDLVNYRVELYKNPNGTKEFPARTCKDLLMCYPTLESGKYWIDPNEGIPNDAFEVLCDFSTNSTCVYPNKESEVLKTERKQWFSGADGYQWFGKDLHGLQPTLEYVSEASQLSFLRLLSDHARQSVTYHCKNSAAWFNEEYSGFTKSIKIMAGNGVELHAESSNKFRPKVTIDECQIKDSTWRKTIVEVDTPKPYRLPLQDVAVYDIGDEGEEFGLEIGPVCFS